MVGFVSKIIIQILKMEKDSISSLKGDAHSIISVLEDEVKTSVYAFPIVLQFVCIIVW
jgi:hypothetical protein